MTRYKAAPELQLLCFSAVGCPYSDINLNKDSVLPDRLSGEMPGSGVGRPRRAEPSAEISADANE